MHPYLAPRFRRATLIALLLSPALVAATVPAPVRAQTTTPSNPPAADGAAATPTSPLSDIRLPEGATLVNDPNLTAAVNKLLTGIAVKSNFQATGTEVWTWDGPHYKEAEAADIMDAVARKLRRADYTYRAGNPQKNDTSTMTLFTAKSADKSLLGAWREAKTGLFLAWCELKPAAGNGGSAPAPAQPVAPPPPAPAPPPAPRAQPAPPAQTPPQEDAFTTVSKITGIVMRMGPSRVDSENNIKFLTSRLKQGPGETQAIGPVEALMWRGPAVDEVTIKSDKKDILDAIQKLGYAYQEGATKAEPGDATYTYFTAQRDRQALQGMWRFDPANHTFILTWAATLAGGGVAAGVPSALTGIALPHDGVAVPTEALINALTTLLQRAAAADQKKVTNVEAFAWKGETYKPDQADAIKDAVTERLQKLGFTAEASAPDNAAAISYFRAHSATKAIQGLWRKSDTMLILAWGELTGGQ